MDWLRRWQGCLRASPRRDEHGFTMSGPIEDGHMSPWATDSDTLVTVLAIGFLLSVWACIWMN